MSGEFEAVGAAATAGLVAGAIEQGGAHKEGEGVCINCGAALKGRYCSACGQATHVHRSLFHMAEELLHNFFHFDTKTWRTQVNFTIVDPDTKASIGAVTAEINLTELQRRLDAGLTTAQ